ncbi:MAG: hypothetical protein ABJQ23_09790 [Shimia thalassica]|uniref:hypothetical protein n=1 Tax=Shimia thalassica TaxID=1715693 RepID=UPI00329A736B
MKRIKLKPETHPSRFDDAAAVKAAIEKGEIDDRFLTGRQLMRKRRAEAASSGPKRRCTLSEAEDTLTHLPHYSRDWWRAIRGLTGMGAGQVLSEYHARAADEDEDEEDHETGIDVDAILRQNNL